MTTAAPGDRPGPEPHPAAQPPSGAAQPQSTELAAPERVSIDEFMRIDLRVARVLAAEKVKGTRKLVKMEIDLGTERRTIVAGIAEAYGAEALVGKSLVVVTNLQPVKIAGIESNGMLLAASPEGGQPVLVGFEQPPAPGTRVR